MRRLWSKLSGLVACLVAVCLPYRARLVLARLLHCLAHPSGISRTRFFRGQMRVWNKLLLGLVFWLGLAPSRLFFLFWGRSRLAPPGGSESYWVERQSPEELEDQIEDTF